MRFDGQGTCKVCYKDFESGLYSGVCEECFHEQDSNIDVLYKIGKTENEKVELNCFLTSVFTKEEIEEILLNHLKLCKKISFKLDFSDFISQDEMWFADRLAEVMKSEK